MALAQTELDDFVLYYPKFETKLNCFIPQVNVDDVGDMTLLYDMSCVEKNDFYNKNPYATYSYGDQSLMVIEDELIRNDDTHILLIHDSFCDCVIPFISLGCKRVDAIDLRYITGSLESYIREEKTDIVIVAYDVGYDETNWATQKNNLYFR